MAGYLEISAHFETVAVALVLIAASILVIMSPRVITYMIAASPFISRYSFEVASLDIRPEIVVGACAWIFIIISRTKIDLGRLRHSPTWALIAAWLALSFLISTATSPMPIQSYSIIVWVGANLGSAAFIALYGPAARTIIKFSLWVSLIAGIVGIALWVSSLLGTQPTWGLQADDTYGGYAAYVTAFEANIFAGLIVMWSIIGLTTYADGAVPRWLRVALVVVAPFTAIAAHTRAALLACIVGALLLGIASARGTAARRAGALMVGTLLTIAMASGLFAFDGLSKFSNATSLFSEGTGAYRVDTWSTALQDLDNPGKWTLGLGTNSFPQRHVDPTHVSTEAPWYLGNLFLQILYDGGLVALVMFSAVAIALIRGSRSAQSAILLLVYCILSFATSVLWLAQTWVWFGLAIALLPKGPPASAPVATPRPTSGNVTRGPQKIDQA